VKDESGGRRLDDPNDFVAIEIAAALARDILVIPVLVDGAHMPKASELPASLKPLARRHAVDVRHTHFGHDAEALVARMREVLGDHVAGPRRWPVRAAIGAAVVAVLLLFGWGGVAFIQHMVRTVEQPAQPRAATAKGDYTIILVRVGKFEEASAALRSLGYRVNTRPPDPGDTEGQHTVISIGDQVPYDIAAPVIKISRKFLDLKYVFLAYEPDYKRRIFINAHDDWVNNRGLKALSPEDFVRLTEGNLKEDEFHSFVAAFGR
jgi:hypothetical protein